MSKQYQKGCLKFFAFLLHDEAAYHRDISDDEEPIISPSKLVPQSCQNSYHNEWGYSGEPQGWRTCLQLIYQQHWTGLEVSFPKPNFLYLSHGSDT